VGSPRDGVEVVVRPLEPADRAVWERLFRGYIAFYERTIEDAEYERAWGRLLADREIHGLAAVVEGELVGITHFLRHAHTNSADVCYLQDLFTDPDARGQGVGRALIDAVTEWANGQGCSRVYWLTQSHNERARRLYDQVADERGFVVYQIML
jgi:GNAT superfamily N-acetyltransferase